MLDGFLVLITVVISFVSLALSLWLGFYIAVRSPHSKASWLAGATLWSLSGHFLNSLIFIQSPLGQGVLPWWWGWSIALAASFLFHLTISLLPGKPTKKQVAAVVFVYLVILIFIAIEAYTPWKFAGTITRTPLYHDAQQPSLLFPIFGLFLVVIPAFSLYNLYLGWRQTRNPLIQRQFVILSWATALAIFSGLYSASSIWFGLNTPVFIGNLGLGVGVVLLGFAVARYNTLIEGRTIALDFIYTSIINGVIIGVYLLATFLSSLIFDVPFIVFIFIIILAIISHALYDWTRTYLDRFFYRQQYRDLRANLRDFVHTTTPDGDLQGRLRAILQTICCSLGVSRGFIALRDEESFVVAADWQAGFAGQRLASDALTPAEITVLSPSEAPSTLADMALIVPLYAGGEQVGSLVLGSQKAQVGYTEDDFDLLDDCADTVASVVHTVRLQKENVQQIEATLKAYRQREQELQSRMRAALTAKTEPPVFEGQSEKEIISLVEDALRHLDDYAYLGEHKLAQLQIIHSRLDVREEDFITHLDRGKALHKVLIAAIEKLRPSGSMPSPLTREWHQYIILYDCYVQGKLNREVISSLYISESTFSRARRRAVRAVARVVGELEQKSR